MISTTTIMTLLAVFAVVTTLLTQAVKVILDELKVKYASNVLVLIISVAVGFIGTAIYYENQQVPFNALTSVYLAIMGLANWLVSMHGYDKVKQAFKQIAEIK